MAKYSNSDLYLTCVCADSVQVECVAQEWTSSEEDIFKIGRKYWLHHGWLTRPNGDSDVELWWVEYRGRSYICWPETKNGATSYTATSTGFTFV